MNYLLKRALVYHPPCCSVCGRSNCKLEVDHYPIPRIAGGSDDPDNLRPICNMCHRFFTNKLREQYMAYVTIDGKYTKRSDKFYPKRSAKPKLAGSRSKYAGRQAGW